ncbi:MAG: YggU family protein [Magnetococcales bacterium]|nr:YggU family protein [Magnetococcales bacterium]
MPVQWRGGDLLLAIRVQPRASRVGVTGLQGSAIKVALTAPPVEGAANQALCHWLAEELQVAKNRVSLVSGAHARDKRIRIQGTEKAAVLAFCRRWQLPEPT